MLNNHSLRLIDLYNLKDLNLSTDEAVQSVVHSIIDERQKEIIEKHLAY